MHKSWLAVLALLAVGVASICPAVSRAQEVTPCVTKSECDLRQDAIDTKNRQDAWNASIKREDDYAAQRAQLRAQAKADANNGSISRSQEIMRRRHAAAATN